MGYPTVTLPTGVDPKPYTYTHRVSAADFKRISEPIRRLVPADLPLEPGDGFGPFRGDHIGKVHSFEQTMHNLFISESALKALQDYGLRGLVVAPTEIRVPKRYPEKLFEIQVEPRARLSAEVIKEGSEERCEVCGYERVELVESCYRYVEFHITDPQKLKVRASSIPADRPVFGLRELGGIYVTEEFVGAVQKLKLTNIRFIEVGLAEH